MTCFFRELFGKKLELIQSLVESKEKNPSPCDLLVNLFWMPLQHLHGYNGLLLKLANCFEVVSKESISHYALKWNESGMQIYDINLLLFRTLRNTSGFKMAAPNMKL